MIYINNYSSQEKPLNIRCAICSKLVDRITSFVDIRNQNKIILAYCHGDVDRMELQPHEMMRKDFIDQILNQEGVAFSTRRIESEQS